MFRRKGSHRGVTGTTAMTSSESVSMKEENFHIFVSDYLFFFTTCKLQYMICILLYCSGHARVLCACCRENYM